MTKTSSRDNTKRVPGSGNARFATLLRFGYPDCGSILRVRALLPWQRVRIEGYSMTPTLLPGDEVLVRHGGPVRPGALVLAVFRSRPDLLVVKRTLAETGDGWLLASDNTEQGSDSRQYGVADVLAPVVWIWRRGGPPARFGGWRQVLRPAGWRRLARRWWGMPPTAGAPEPWPR